MPFTLDGQWIPTKQPVFTNSKPIKVRLVKKGNNILTVVHNLNMNEPEMMELASRIKKKLGCGGAVKDGEVVIQGDKVEDVIKVLISVGIKAS